MTASSFIDSSSWRPEKQASRSGRWCHTLFGTAGRRGTVPHAAHAAGDSTQRPVAQRAHSHQVRAQCPHAGFVVGAASGISGLPASLREVPASICRGKRSRGRPCWAARGDIFLDLFGGVGRVGRKVSLAGCCNSLLLDISFGFDLLARGAVSDITSYIRNGKVRGVMLAIPCNSFSAARRAPIGSRMPRRLRSDDFPFGIPGLNEKDQQTAALGNSIVKACARIIRCCDAAGIPWVVENPRSSFLWKMPAIRRIQSSAHVRISHLDQCRYSCPWMKPTTMMTGWCQASPQLEQRCSPPQRGICGATGRKHFVLDGPGLTKQAQTYSHALAAAITRTFREAWTVKYVSVVDSVLRR